MPATCFHSPGRQRGACRCARGRHTTRMSACVAWPPRRLASSPRRHPAAPLWPLSHSPVLLPSSGSLHRTTRAGSSLLFATTADTASATPRRSAQKPRLVPLFLLTKMEGAGSPGCRQLRRPLPRATEIVTAIPSPPSLLRARRPSQRLRGELTDRIPLFPASISCFSRHPLEDRTAPPHELVAGHIPVTIWSQACAHHTHRIT